MITKQMPSELFVENGQPLILTHSVTVTDAVIFLGQFWEREKLKPRFLLVLNRSVLIFGNFKPTFWKFLGRELGKYVFIFNREGFFSVLKETNHRDIDKLKNS